MVFNQTHVHHTFARQTQVLRESSDRMLSTYHSYTSYYRPLHLLQFTYVRYYMCSVPATLALHDKFGLFDTFPQYLLSWRAPPLLHALPPKFSTACQSTCDLSTGFNCTKMIIDHLQNHWSRHHIPLHFPQMLPQDWPHSPAQDLLEIM